MIHELDMGEFEPSVEVRTFGEGTRVYIIDCESFETVIVPHDRLGNFIDTLVSMKNDFDSREGL